MQAADAVHFGAVAYEDGVVDAAAGAATATTTSSTSACCAAGVDIAVGAAARFYSAAAAAVATARLAVLGVGAPDRYLALWRKSCCL